MQKGGKKKPLRKPQSQSKPGLESKMTPPPKATPGERTSGKLKNKVALITGGDSGIGRAVAVLFASEGAKIAIAYLSEQSDAEETRRLIEAENSECLLIASDLSKEINCRRAVAKVIKAYGRIDILVNNAAVHYEQSNFEDISTDQLLKTFATNFFSYFWITQAALPSIPEGGCVINTASVTAYRGSAALIDYASTKGAIVSFTRSLASNL
jgi:NAD(P)-dependent dehydrogenase (short-subunit alcohol dehydrogenase family)